MKAVLKALKQWASDSEVKSEVLTRLTMHHACICYFYFSQSENQLVSFHCKVCLQMDHLLLCECEHRRT